MAPPQDLVRAVRGLARRPGFSLAAILTLACLVPALRAARLDPVAILREP